LVSVGSGVAAVYYLDLLSVRNLRFSVITVLPALAIVLIGAIALGIITGNIPGTQPAFYSFSSPQEASDGAYQLLGTDSGLLYLRACSRTAPLIAVDSSSVRNVRYPTLVRIERVTSNSGLLDVLTDHGKVNMGLASCVLAPHPRRSS